MKINVLGEKCTIVKSIPSKHPLLKRCDGYCDYTVREIVLHPHSGDRDDVEIADSVVSNKRIIRHELIHAFLFESGLSQDAEWPAEEAMVDFFARQFPKMLKAFQDANAL